MSTVDSQFESLIRLIKVHNTQFKPNKGVLIVNYSYLNEKERKKKHNFITILNHICSYSKAYRSD